jgi:hypothetical protein
MRSEGGVSPRDSGLFWLFGVTLFIGSALMFLAEPLVSKMALPVLGGGPMIWSTCVLFFQITLLAGYCYAWGMSRWLRPRLQVAAHVAVLIAPFIVLPLRMDAIDPSHEGNPIGWLIMRLATAIGLPFFALSTTTPLFQQWFAQSQSAGDRTDAYSLYSVSNLGSFFALLAYPAVIEPTLRLRSQSVQWTAAYGIFIVLALVAMASVWHSLWGRSDRAGEAARVPQPSWRRRLEWTALSMVPSSLMLGVTSYFTTDLAAIPLLWVLPLAVYLLTYVLAFSPAGPRFTALADKAVPLLILPITLLIVTHRTVPLVIGIPLHLMGLLACALVCHGTLAAHRPNAPHLAQFYVWIAFGGMIGGTFNTVVASNLFTNISEYPIALALACALRPGVSSWDRGSIARLISFPAAVFAGAGALFAFIGRLNGNDTILLSALAVPALLAFSQARNPIPFALSVAAITCAGWWFWQPYGNLLYADRSFFGVYRIQFDPDAQYHVLYNGTTLHGMQAVAGSSRTMPLAYYHRAGPFGQLFESVGTRVSEVAVVGLGVGALASYAAPEQHWTFYEIDPLDEQIARTPRFFTHLDDCADRCAVVLGDARQSLVRTASNRFDLIVLDAFSSDAIPIHLLTKEALELYLARLAPQGSLAFHISNRRLSLGPVLARLANSLGLVALEQFQGVSARDRSAGQTPSDWMVMARDRADLGTLVHDPRWVVPALLPSTPLWTDDFSNILSVLAWN